MNNVSAVNLYILLINDYPAFAAGNVAIQEPGTKVNGLWVNPPAEHLKLRPLAGVFGMEVEDFVIEFDVDAVVAMLSARGYAEKEVTMAGEVVLEEHSLPQTVTDTQDRAWSAITIKTPVDTSKPLADDNERIRVFLAPVRGRPASAKDMLKALKAKK